MKKIPALHTGDTISIYTDEVGNVRPDTDDPMNHIGANLEDIQVTALGSPNVPSPHIIPKHVLKLYQGIKRNADNYDGIVIIHGTDTPEETAHFLDTMEIPNVPTVLAGVMCSSNELGNDGVYNYPSTPHVASHNQAIGKDVLVVTNDEIHAAKYITKTHTTSVSAFQAPIRGPLDLITRHDIFLFGVADPRVRFDLQDISGTAPIAKVYADMGEDSIISFLSSSNVCGVVVEALGTRNASPHAAQEIIDLIKQGAPTVLISRCFNGIAEPVYAYEGGGVQLVKIGVMFVKELNAWKAHLKLFTALNAGLKG